MALSFSTFMASSLISDDSSTGGGLVLFNESVLPRLTKHCLECHSHEAGEAGGSLGPAIVH